MRRDIRVLAVDDQDVFLRACERLIAATDGFTWAASARSGAQALTVLEDSRADLVLVDVRMPGMDGLETARRLVEQRSDIVVILVSVAPALDTASALRTSGAVAYVRKHALSPATLRRVWAAHGAARVSD